MAASEAAPPRSIPSIKSSVVRPDIIVCDNGTGYLKAGFAGEELPRLTCPSMVGRPMLRADEDLIEGVELKVSQCPIVYMG